MKEYNSILLEDNEVEFLLDITQLTGEIFRAVSFPGDIDTALENYQFESNETFWYESNHIIMLYFSDSIFNILFCEYIILRIVENSDKLDYLFP